MIKKEVRMGLKKSVHQLIKHSFCSEVRNFFQNSCKLYKIYPKISQDKMLHLTPM